MTGQSAQQGKGFQFNIDYKKLFYDTLRFWWLIVLSLIASVAIVVSSHRYAIPIYRASMSMIMEERGTEMPQSNMMEGFGLTPGLRSVDNQIAMLGSFDMSRKAVGQLDFFVSYYAKGTLKETELYGSTPFKVNFDSIAPQLLNVPFYITVLNSESFILEFSVEKSASTYFMKSNNYGPSIDAIQYKEKHQFDKPIVTKWFNFVISNQGAAKSESKAYYFMFNHPDAQANKFRSGFSAQKTSENSSIVRISVTGPNMAKNIAYLNKLSKVFIEANLDKKNQIAENAIFFIERQLINISDSLKLTGSQLSKFRAQNNIQSLSTQSGVLFSKLQEYDKSINDKQLLIGYYNYLLNYFSADTLPAEVLAPALYPTDNPVLSQQINNIIELNTQRLTIAEYNNPYDKELMAKINVVRQTLLTSLKNQSQILGETIHRLKTEKALIEFQITSMPETERQLLGIQRQYELNNEVYNFLLRKRSEAQIQKASNTPDHQILESAKPAGQVSPQARANYQKAIIIGLLVPMAFIVLLQLLNNKIESNEDVERLTNLPIIGQIIHNTREEANHVHNHPRSVVTETFRRVRSRIEFLTEGKTSPIITVTSSMPGEGKTFCSLNLAAVFAYSGKKTIIVGFDMRKPGLNKVLQLNNHNGLSNYLIGKSSLDEIVHSTEQENLWVIPSGPIPPNPSELIGGANTAKLFKKLKDRYDIIILDTPPMGIVSDPYLVARHADSVLFLSRHGFTRKDIFATTVANMQDEGIKNIGIIINDIELKKKNYGYNYGYGHGYYEEV